jgi:Flp pilus assembly protein TadD
MGWIVETQRLMTLRDSLLRSIPFLRLCTSVIGFCLIAGCKRPDAMQASEKRDHADAVAPAPAVAAFLEPEKDVFARYAGSESCRACHAALFESWASSNHGLAERKVSSRDKAAFEPERAFSHGKQQSKVSARDGAFRVETLGFDGKTEVYPVVRVVGNDPLRQFLVERPGGRFQTLEVAFDPHKGDWFNVYGNEDRQPGEWGHWTGRGMNWNTMCASCHNTRLRKNYDVRDDVFRTSMAEMSVGCESCHGPMKEHVDWRTTNPGAKTPDPTVKRADREQMLDTCGSCHARRRELTGDFVPGEKFSAHFQLTTVDESDLYFADGQVRDELYEYGSFLSSKMHHAGVRCVDCHDPHKAKPKLVGNTLCQTCHAGGAAAPGGTVRAPVIVPETHSFHKDASVTCQSCHMPVTTYMQRHPRHDHSFSIPDPLLTKELGIPNACSKCHSDKDVEWAIAAADKWWGEKLKRPTRERARLVAAARAGKEGSGSDLEKAVRGEVSPYWKASLLRLLGPWMDDAQIGRLFMEYAQHSDPLVRTAAVQGLETVAGMGSEPARQILFRKLEDPDRSVRVAAAWALRASVDEATRAGRELAHTLEIAGDQPAGRLALGVFAQAKGRPDEAVQHFEKAVSWDLRSAGLRHEFAILLAELEKPLAALNQIREAVKLEPANAEFRYKLALAINETGGVSSAVSEFEEAVRLDPKHARAWYNLGLARNQMRNTKGAIDALRSGEIAAPRDPRIPYARATIHASAGQKDEAKAAVERALELAPNMPEARKLLEQL